MDITPHLGIGDLLILKMKEITNKFDLKNININVKLIEEYSDNYEIKLDNCKNLIAFLFPYCNISTNNGPCDYYILNNYPLKQTYIYNFINKNLINIDNKYSDYIIFHTKCRHDSLIDRFQNEIIKDLNFFLENFTTKKTILIMGEKFIGINLETQQHKTISLYDNLLLLKKKNNVIDLTYDILTCGNKNFDNFIFDIELINKADCNITFGIGGPLNLCKAFSEKNVSFIPFYKLSPFVDTLSEMMDINNSLLENIEEFSEKINYFII
jgi:hypothetical protein